MKHEMYIDYEQGMDIACIVEENIEENENE